MCMQKIDLLDEARKTAGDAKLIWWKIEHEHGEGRCGDYGDCPRYDWQGPACMAQFLGRAIVYGVPAEYNL